MLDGEPASARAAEACSIAAHNMCCRLHRSLRRTRCSADQLMLPVVAAGSSLQGQVLKAFTMWLKLNPELTDSSDAALAGHPLVLLSLSGLQHAALFDEAVDATAELIYSSGLMMHHGQPHSRYMPLVQELVHAVRLPLFLDLSKGLSSCS